MKLGKVVATGIALTLMSSPFAHSAETGVSPEAKAAYQAAKVTFKANIEAYRSARATAKAQITTARSTFETAKSSASTPEAKKAARDVFLAAKKNALASVPAKPTKPTKP
jgi:hypothetical protein